MRNMRSLEDRNSETKRYKQPEDTVNKYTIKLQMAAITVFSTVCGGMFIPTYSCLQNILLTYDHVNTLYQVTVCLNTVIIG